MRIVQCTVDTHYFDLNNKSKHVCQCGEYDHRTMNSNHSRSHECWCEPELKYRDAANNEVWEHREVH